ncbi:MAG: eL32 family ribosomal protein [Nanoarchaeota archaeon]
MRKKFLRRGTNLHFKLGKSRRKIRRWRKPRGDDNKVRKNKQGREKKVEVGYRKPRGERWRIKGKEFIIVRNLKDAGRVEKNKPVIIGKLGRKKREEIIKKIIESGGKILNKK